MKIKCADKTNAPLKPAAHFYGGGGPLCRSGCYRGIGWLPGSVCGKDCRTGRRTCRCVAGQVVIGASDGCRVVFVGRIAGQVAGRADVLPGRSLYGHRMVAATGCRRSGGRVPGMAAAGYSRLFRVSGCCRTTTGATGPRFSCRALGAVTRPFPRQAAAGSPPCSACGAVRGKSSRV